MKSAQKNFMKENAQLFQETPSGLEKAKQLQEVKLNENELTNFWYILHFSKEHFIKNFNNYLHFPNWIKFEHYETFFTI